MTEQTLDTVPARAIKTTVKQSEGKITMSESSEFSLRIDKPRLRPLSETETHTTLKLSNDDSTVHIELDAVQLDALIDDLYQIQQRGESAEALHD